MKLALVSLIIVISFSAHADLEHKQGQGALPERQKLSNAHNCFAEIDLKGCGHPRDDQEFFIACLDDNKDKLTP